MSDSDLITPERFDAVLFDLDGVLTATAKIHAACWKQMFDRFLRQYATSHNLSFQPFDLLTDYNLYVDGKALDDGVRSFLESRHIELPEGSPTAPPDWETVHGLGNQKDSLVNQVIASDGVEAFPGQHSLCHPCPANGAENRGRHAQRQLRTRAQVGRDYATSLISGLIERWRPGNGWPASPPRICSLAAADKLNVLPARAVVIEDAISGVQSGRAGNFGLVIGVDRRGHGDLLKASGADIVVKDVGDLLSSDGAQLIPVLLNKQDIVQEVSVPGSFP